MPRISWRWITFWTLFLSLVASPLRGHANNPQQGSPPNLIGNPGFESGLAPWKLCGGAERVDARADGPGAVHGGRYAIRLGNPTTEAGCPEPPPGYEYLGPAPQAAYQEVTIPAGATAVTVSFWYWAGESLRSDLNIQLAPDVYDSILQPGGVYLGRITTYDLPGWVLFRQVLEPDELAEVRGKTLFLVFQLDELDGDDETTYYVDDVAVTPAEVRTLAAPLPPALNGDGSRPIAYVRSDPDNPYSQSLYRMDTDGQNAALIYEGELHDVGEPVWSNSGAQIALIDGNVYPPGETDPNQWVSATALTVVGADGSNPRQIHQTTGMPGNPDFIQELTELSWAPDDSGLAASIFAYNRYDDGRLEGGLARIDLINALNGNVTHLLDYGTSPDWSSANRLIFEAYDLLGDSRDESIWELDVSRTPIVERRLVAGNTFVYDEYPAWAPDGRHFATVRQIGGRHYDEDGDEHYNHAVMHWDREQPENPRMLLLADHGTVRQLTWSPDGRYLLYTLATEVENEFHEDIWWLDVTTGQTGPITTDGLSDQADWRPRCPGGLSTAAINQCPGGTSGAVYLPMLRR
ncbi:MAG TPA: hypothetical protein VER55_14430 [Ardenticatenaceae bacterium]|nr:hypothetical protein [Ardenticatenaceae bacterium]